MKLLERVCNGSAVRPFFAPGLVLLIVFGATIGGTLILRKQENARLELLLQRRSDSATALLWSALDRDEETLFVLRDLFNHSDGLTRRQFEGAVREVLIRHPEVGMIGWAPLESAADRPRFDSARLAESNPGSQISDADPVTNQLIPAGSRAEYFPLYYAEPSAGDLGSLGMDFSNFLQPKDLELTRHTGVLIATDPPRAGRTSPNDRDYILTLAVGFSGLEATPDSHRGLRGLLCSVIHVSTLVRASVTHEKMPDVDVIVIDENATEGRPLYQSGDGVVRPLDRAASALRASSEGSWHNVRYP